MLPSARAVSKSVIYSSILVLFLLKRKKTIGRLESSISGLSKPLDSKYAARAVFAVRNMLLGGCCIVFLSYPY